MTVRLPTNRMIRLGLIAAIAATGVAGWYFLVREDSPPPAPGEVVDDAPPPDPRLTYPTSFRNVKPDVHYVGDAACAACHGEIDKTYHGHPMGRSAAFVGKSPPIERFDAAAHNPSVVGPYELVVEWSGGKMLHRVRAKDADGKQLPDYQVTADLAIGSGTRGRSYLSIQNGAVWQTPISWYGAEARWDLSPGFDLSNGGKRAIEAACLFCHVNHVELVAGANNRYREPLLAEQAAIGCERCHGPGELHVRERESGPLVDAIDTSIVNPKHLTPELRAGICAQCHLQGEQRVPRRGRELDEFRPGLPLEAFLTVFVRHPDLAEAHRSVGQFEQMYQSVCFNESKGKLECTSCHDPHSSPPAATRERVYSARCANCHGNGSPTCSEMPAVRQAKNDNCIACHMPKANSSNIIHTSVTDHRILRRPSAAQAAHGLPPDAIPLIPFRLGADMPAHGDEDRDLGIALQHMAFRISVQEPAARRLIASMASDRLDAAVGAAPTDLPAWLALSRVRGLRGDSAGRLDAAMTAAKLNPRSETAASELADAAAAEGRFDVAIDAATKLVEMNPTAVDPLLVRANIFIQQRNWEKAEADCRLALGIHPLHPVVRLYLAACLHARGDVDGSRKQLNTAVLLVANPQARAAYLDWFSRATK